MKKFRIINIALLGMLITMFSACVDDVSLNSLEEPAGGTVTKDTVFSSAEYTKEFLNTLYSFQYYGLPFANTSSWAYPQESSNIYVGKVDALTDLYTFTYSGAGINSNYYLGTHTSNYGIRSDKWDYTRNRVWEAVRFCWLLIENIDGVPGLTDNEKAEMVAETKCIMAARYFDTFRHYGGLPIITHSFSGTESGYDLPRASVDSTVQFMVGLLDDAIKVLPWNVNDPNTDTGRWTQAAAMALKCRILQFAASPLFNDTEPYYPGATGNSAIWYGGYKPELWTECLQACKDFFAALNANGYYALQQAAGTRPQDYRLAYRNGYTVQGSHEILLETRVTTNDAFKSSYYNWHTWGDPLGSIRRSYCPTQEYMEMFPWKDGKPFNWDAAKANNQLDTMFMKGSIADKNISLTRDPRLYEEMVVNGEPVSLDWTTGNMSGVGFENWVGGYHARLDATTQSGAFATGYAPMKFFMGNDMLRRYPTWPYIRLSEMYLIYAEAIAQSGGSLKDACDQVDIVRARVGLKGLVKSNPTENLTSDKDAFIEELLRERACELGLEDARFFDLIRYKRADIFSKQLHGLRMYRLDAKGNRVLTVWYGSKDAYPYSFDYEKFELSNPIRYWWTNGFDPKWYLSPFPLTEVNKGYGLVQNPGW